MSVVKVENIRAENIIVKPITDKSWHTPNGMYYGFVEYKYSRGEDKFNIIIKNLTLKRNLIDPFKSTKAGGYHQSKYDAGRYKAIISLKDYPQVAEKLKIIDEAFESCGKQNSYNFVIDKYLNKQRKKEINYSKIVKTPEAGIDIYREKNANAKNFTDEQIAEIMGLKIKPILKVNKKSFDEPNTAETEIDCVVRYGDKVEIGDDDNEVQGLDFFEKTFVKGCVVDIVLQISSWTSNPRMCTYGPKIQLSDITLVERAKSNTRPEKLVIDGEEDDVFAGTKKAVFKKKTDVKDVKPVKKVSKKSEKPVEEEEKESSETFSEQEDVSPDEEASEEASPVEQKPTKPRAIRRKPRQEINTEDDE